MADRSVLVRLRAEVDDYKRRMAEAEQAVQKNRTAVNDLANDAGALGLALTGLALLATKRFADFDQAMSNVQASTHETAENMGLLRQAALDAGASTVFSATEAAGAIEALSKAGVSTKDILGGGLKGALDLAAAGNLDVAQSAEIAATTMVQFGKDGKDVTHISDLLAAGAGKAQGEVTDMALALKYAGVPLAQLGVSMEETTGTIALFAKNGIIGEQAGTSLRSMIASLTSPSAQAAKTMDDLGISVFDANGKFVGLDGVAGQLQSQLGSLTDAERTNALGRIFGNESLQAANVLTAQGAEAVREWTAAVDDQGYAAETAATRLDNLKGDWEALSGAVETGLIGMGEGADGPLRSLTQNATNAVDAFNQLPEPIKQTTGLIAGGGGLTLLGIAALGKMVLSINDTRQAFRDLSISAKTAGVAAAGIGAVVAIGSIALANWAENAAEAKAETEAFLSTLDEYGHTTNDTIRMVNDNLAKATFGQSIGERLLGDDPVALIDYAKKLGIATDDLTGYVLGEAAAVDRVVAARDAYTDQFGLQDQDRNKAASLTDILDQQADKLSDAEKQSARKALADQAAGVAADDLTEAVTATTDAMAEQTRTLADLLDEQAQAADVVMSVWEAQNKAEEAYDDATAALEENGATLDATTDKGRTNRAALLDIADAGLELVQSMEANGSAQSDLQGTMQQTRDRFIEVAAQMGMSADEANALADQLHLIPSDVTVTALFDPSQADTQMQAFVDRWAGRTVTVKALMDLGFDRSNAASGARYTALALAAAGKADGGRVSGPGGPTDDKVPAWLSDGEYVVRAASVDKYGVGFLDALNDGRLGLMGVEQTDWIRLAAGGLVRNQYGLASAETVYAPGPRRHSRDLFAQPLVHR